MKRLAKHAAWILALAIVFRVPLAHAATTLVDAAHQLVNIVPIANGGLNSSATPGTGQIPIFDGTKYAPGDPLIGGLGASGAVVSFTNCDSSAVYDASTNGATQLVALASGKTVYVCGFSFAQSTATAVHVSLEYGTGTACATSPTKITPAYSLQATSSTGPAGIAIGPGIVSGLQTAASNELCILTDAAVSVQALVWYTQR